MRRIVDQRLGLATATVTPLVALTVLVATGASNPLDRYAADHWMIDLTPHRPRLFTFSGLVYPNAHGSGAEIALAIWRYPASLFISSLLLLGCAYALGTKGRRRAALAWCALFAVGNVLELVGKLTITRPALHSAIGRLDTFDHSFPSGHTIRALLVAAAISATWPRFRTAALVWGATAPLALVPLADHVPTDVLGGALVVALLLVLGDKSVAERPGFGL